jgi:quinol monooxygenase YgiN
MTISFIDFSALLSLSLDPSLPFKLFSRSSDPFLRAETSCMHRPRGAAAPGVPDAKPRSLPMTANIASDTVTLVNVLTVDPANHDTLVALLRDNTDTTISTLKGWIATSLIASKDKRKVIIYSQWQTLADVEAMRTEARMVAYFPRLAALAAFDSIVGDVVYTGSH